MFVRIYLTYSLHSHPTRNWFRWCDFLPNFPESSVIAASLVHSVTTFTDRRKFSTTALLFVPATFCCKKDFDAQSFVSVFSITYNGWCALSLRGLLFTRNVGSYNEGERSPNRSKSCVLSTSIIFKLSTIISLRTNLLVLNVDTKKFS